MDKHRNLFPLWGLKETFFGNIHFWSFWASFIASGMLGVGGGGEGVRIFLLSFLMPQETCCSYDLSNKSAGKTHLYSFKNEFSRFL